jgi:hypothetical protein
MLALPMEIVGPVLGIGTLIALVVGGIIAVRVVAARFPSPRDRARGLDLAERDQLIDDLQARVAELEQVKEHVMELEERLDFAERLLTQQREAPPIGPAPGG